MDFNLKPGFSIEYTTEIFYIYQEDMFKDYKMKKAYEYKKIYKKFQTILLVQLST